MKKEKCPMVGTRAKWTHQNVIAIALAFAGLFFLSLPTGRAASAEKPSPPISANFEQEWTKLIAAAKQEGTVAIASGGAPSRQYRPVVDVFQKKFGVTVEVSTGNATDTVNRVLAERKAGKYTMDVALISSRENNQRLVPSGSLIPFAPLLIHPEVLDKSAWYRSRYWYSDKDSKYTFIYHVSKEDQYETWYNTEKIKETEIATIKKQTDFFDPKWKGKIAGQGMGDPSGLRQMIDSYFEPDRGQEWVGTYLLNAGITFSEDRRILETWLTGGRFPLQAVATGSEDLIALAKKGLPIKASISSQAGRRNPGRRFRMLYFSVRQCSSSQRGEAIHQLVSVQGRPDPDAHHDPQHRPVIVAQ